jgi:hypothetical protein
LKIKPIFILPLILLIFISFPQSIASEEGQVETFHSLDKFFVPSSNGSISFAVGGSYALLKEENSSLHFYGLILDNYVLNFTDPHIDIAKGTVTGRDILNYTRNNGDFSVAIQDCNVIILNYDILAKFLPAQGWLNYTVSGVGSQSFNLHYTGTVFQPLNWTVFINDTVVPEEMWYVSSDGWVTVSSSNTNVSIFFEMIDSPKDEPIVPQDTVTLSVTAVIIVLIMLTTIIIFLLRRQAKKQF